MRGQIGEYWKLVGGNVIFRNRCEGIGFIDREMAVDYEDGPESRATGVAYDVRRRAIRHLRRFDFEIPTRTTGDCFARFESGSTRLSLRIIEQAVAQIPDGPIAPKKVPKRWKVPGRATSRWRAVADTTASTFSRTGA